MATPPRSPADQPAPPIDNQHTRTGADVNTNHHPRHPQHRNKDTALNERLRTTADTYMSPAVVVTHATDPDDYTCQDLAYNPNTGPHTLAALICGTDDVVRLGVARNRNTPAATLIALAAHTNEHVRREVARNPNTPIDTIRALATDTNPLVAEAAGRTGRVNCLNRYANTLPEPGHTHALLLVEAGFPGWPEQLATVLRIQSPITVTRHDSQSRTAHTATTI